MMKISKYLVAAVLLTGFGTANAAHTAEYGLKITAVYASAPSNGNQAHLIALDRDIGHGCGSRVAIELDAKMLFTTALTKHMAGSTVNALIETDSTPLTSAGHQISTCKAFSIW